MLIALSQMVGSVVQGTDQRLGTLSNIVFDGQHWVVRYVVIDTSNWFPGHEIPLRPTELNDLQWGEHRVSAQLSKSQAELGPRTKFPDPMARQMQRELSQYYQLPIYWSVDPIYAAAVPELHVSADQSSEIEKMQLDVRSGNEIHSYDIHATDGLFGTVHDLIVDDEFWVVRYVVVDTGHWLPGRKVIFATSWIDRISWTERALYVDLTKAQVESSPHYDPHQIVNRTYEENLYDYHGRQAYWKPPSAG